MYIIIEIYACVFEEYNMSCWSIIGAAAACDTTTPLTGLSFLIKCATATERKNPYTQNMIDCTTL